MGWRFPPERHRWMVWLQGGMHVLFSVERESTQSAVRVDLVNPDVVPFLEVRMDGTSTDFDAELLEEVVAAAVEGDLAFAPAHRKAWAIAIRTTADGLRRRAHG
jgi:hypothetical protein